MFRKLTQRNAVVLRNCVIELLLSKAAVIALPMRNRLDDGLLLLKANKPSVR